MSKHPYTLVEFKDHEGAERAPGHKAMRVHINGSPVLVEKDSIFLDFSDDRFTTVTLTLQPNEIRFNK